jgi:hypothetical protein
MNNSLISLKEYLDKEKTFLIPNYQRGYVWGKSRDSQKNSVQFLIESIKNCYENKTELFLQGVTVSENESEANSNIELIDGQQRTTALYLLLQYLEYDGKFSIDYPIRIQSQDFLNCFKNKSAEEIVGYCAENLDEQFQDIFYFKKTIRIIHEELKNFDKSALIKFLVNDKKIKFLYINIPQERATTVFKMMNGNKAEMKTEEIIKAEMLRLVSNRGINEKGVEQKELEALRWNENLTRSKYAREWDKWLYWWNKDDVKKYYGTTNVMGLLVETFFKIRYPTKPEFNFENFRDNFLRGEDNTLRAKEVFYELRQLQKNFEDVFNSFDEEDEKNRLHNKIGAILTLSSSDDRKKFIQSYFIEQKSVDIDKYLKLIYLGLSFSEIEKVLDKSNNADIAMIQDKKIELLEIIENDNLYLDNKSHAFVQLLRRNIEEDSKLKRKFDFSIWKERSLEHIYPKSKIFQRDDDGIIKNGIDEIINESVIDSTYLDRKHFNKSGSEHCIGNLVLLYKNENSSFGAKDFKEKKSLYFNLNRDKIFRSRHLLHTISVFAQEEWGVEEIQNNKQNFINEIKSYYGI